VATSGSIGNTVTGDSVTYDNVPGNDSATVSTAILSSLNADLAITKSTVSTSVAPGGAMTYTITLRNNGPDAASTVTMTDALPAALRFQSINAPAGFTCTTPSVGATGTITCNAATLANGAVATFTLNVTVAPDATGSITNTATAGSATGDSTTSNGSGSASPVTVGAAVAAGVPTLSEWALILLGALLVAVALVKFR
jgi:uncharacterized repeat protein (TIGR01451 family)